MKTYDYPNMKYLDGEICNSKEFCDIFNERLMPNFLTLIRSYNRAPKGMSFSKPLSFIVLSEEIAE